MPEKNMSNLSCRIGKLDEKALELETAFRKAVDETIRGTHAEGFPIARYDAEKKRAYLEFPDGRREYTDK